MEKVSFIRHNEKMILLEDFSNLKPDEEFYHTVDKAAEIIRSQPPKSILAADQ